MLSPDRYAAFLNEGAGQPGASSDWSAPNAGHLTRTVGWAPPCPACVRLSSF